MAVTQTPSPTPSDEVLENIDNQNDEGGGIEILPETEEDTPLPQVAPTASNEVVETGIAEEDQPIVVETGIAEEDQPIADPLAGLEVTQYETVLDDEASKATVTYTDDEGFTYKRDINVPKNKDGSINQDYLDEILYSQLLGVNNKRAVGAAVFKDPNAVEEDPAPEAEPAPES